MPTHADLPVATVYQTAGRRHRQEDCYHVDSNVLRHFGLDYFAVFDGHGGPRVARYCAENLHKRLAQFLSMALAGRSRNANGSRLGNAVRQALVAAFEDMHASVKALAEAEAKEVNEGQLAPSDSLWSSGTTAVVAIVGPTRIWIANAGDSRAVVSMDGELVAHTTDHKPLSHAAESRRIKSMGGAFHTNEYGVTRLGVMGISMTRAIGDFDHEGLGLIPTPDVITVHRPPGKNVHLILASDGVWDTMTSEDAVSLVMRVKQRAAEKTPTAGPRVIVKIASTLIGKAAFDRGSKDNITVIVADVSI